jgi:hypothetical protein
MDDFGDEGEEDKEEDIGDEGEEDKEEDIGDERELPYWYVAISIWYGGRV